jgi:hypothetical protein
MISFKEYDDGSPHYMNAIKRWSEPRQSGWRFRLNINSNNLLANNQEVEIENWLTENCKSKFEIFSRFNNGHPYVQIFIPTDIENGDNDAMLFYLRWHIE